jgi:hypothetical protein
MQISLPPLPGLQIRNTRGLAFDDTAFGARGDTLVGVFGLDLTELLLGVEVKPGEETELLLPLPGVRANSNLRRLAAVLSVADTHATPATQSTGVKITPGPNGQTTDFTVEVDGPTRPSGVTLRLDGGEPFWTHGAPLAEARYALPDFAGPANEYLDRLTPGEGTISLKLLLRSDSPGRVALADPQYEHSLVQTEFWTNDVDGTLRVDRTLPLDYGTAEALPLRAVADAGAKLQRITLDLGGETGPERLLGSIAAAGNQFATVGGDYAVAQPVMPGIAVQAAGVAAWLESSEAARVYVELQADAAGMPAAGPPLARGELKIGGEQRGWASVFFEAPAPLEADALAWVVLRAIQGRARVALETPASPPLPLVVNRGGPLWRRIASPPPAGLVRLLYLPDAESRSSALELAVERAGGEVAVQRVDPAADPRNIALDLSPGAAEGVRLLVRSRARGQVTIANVVQEYTLA